MPAAVVIRQRMPRLAGERLEESTLLRARVLPERNEMRILGAQHVKQRLLDVIDGRSLRGRRALPQEVAELLGGVRVTAGRLEHPRQRLGVDRSPGGTEARGAERGDTLR